MRLARREKVFGPGPRVPLDREAKCRIMAYAKSLERPPPPSWAAQGATLTRATGEVLAALCGRLRKWQALFV